MPGCEVCDAESEFLFECQACGGQFCAEHIDRAAHDCQAGKPAASDTAAETPPTPTLRTALPSFVLLLAIIAAVAGGLWALSPGGPFGPEFAADDQQPTTTAEPPDRLLQQVNDLREDQNRSLLGYYGPLATLAENRSWSPPTGQATYQIGEGVTCANISVLEYATDHTGQSNEAIASAALSQWRSDPTTESRLLNESADLAGAAVGESNGEIWVRLVVCNSSA